MAKIYESIIRSDFRGAYSQAVIEISGLNQNDLNQNGLNQNCLNQNGLNQNGLNQERS